MRWYEVDGGVVCVVCQRVDCGGGDGRTDHCMPPCTTGLKHPRDNQISNPQELPRTPLIDSHPDIQQLGQGGNDRHRSESSKEGQSRVVRRMSSH